jgi:hypothetical protein
MSTPPHSGLGHLDLILYVEGLKISLDVLRKQPE